MKEHAIPLSFIETRHRLKWSEADLGLREGWLTKADAKAFACKTLGTDFDRISDIQALIDRFADCTQESVQEVRLTWMRLILAWVYHNCDKFEDPLGVVETIYADFDYPKEIYSLVRYNPPLDCYRPQDHSREENIAHLMDLWRRYIEQCFSL